MLIDRFHTQKTTDTNMLIKQLSSYIWTQYNIRKDGFFRLYLY